MPNLFKSALIGLVAGGLATAFTAMDASAQYYAPGSVGHNLTPAPLGLGIDPGFRPQGIYPNVGVGLGPLGAGVGAGAGFNGIGSGANVGVGPLGVAVNGGLNGNGLGAGVNAGIGNTGVGVEGGLSRGGVGAGAGVQLFGFGPAASVGVGDRGPSLGASVGFGPLGTLLIGSHRNSFPGAHKAAAYAEPKIRNNFYQQRNFGAVPYYTPNHYTSAQRPQFRPAEFPVSSPVSRCAAPWVC